MKRLYLIVPMSLFFISVVTLLSCNKDLAPAPINHIIDTTVTNASLKQVDELIPFNSNLTKNDNLSAYQTITGDAFTAMVIDPSRISVVNDPVFGSKRKVMYMDVRNQDTGGLTENPRAQVQTPMNYVAG